LAPPVPLDEVRIEAGPRVLCRGLLDEPEEERRAEAEVGRGDGRRPGRLERARVALAISVPAGRPDDEAAAPRLEGRFDVRGDGRAGGDLEDEVGPGE